MKKIRVSKVYHSVLDADKKPVEDTILSITEYSETGEVLREAQYHENELSTEITRMYENGRIISSEETDHVEGITQRRKYFYEGDRLTGFRDYYNDEDYIETRLEYDDEGRRSVQHLSDNDDEFNGRVEITYSPDGREITEQYYNAWDQPEQKITRTTDEKGNEIRTRTEKIDGDFSTVSVSENTVNELNQITELKRFENDRLAAHSMLKYGDNGLVSEHQVINYEEGTRRDQTHFYNDKDQLTHAEIQVNGVLKFIEYYTYDDAGTLTLTIHEHRVDNDHTVYEATRNEIIYW